ncbi:MAG TPA: hypothetical protein EYP14_07435 [Planctomycetaceae bacterium]|nr:hypothetical protein [Planctomycetaceae bacterium]
MMETTTHNGKVVFRRSTGRFRRKVVRGAWSATASVSLAGAYPENKPPWTVWVDEGRTAATIGCAPVRDRVLGVGLSR